MQRRRKMTRPAQPPCWLPSERPHLGSRARAHAHLTPRVPVLATDRRLCAHRRRARGAGAPAAAPEAQRRRQPERRGAGGRRRGLAGGRPGGRSGGATAPPGRLAARDRVGRVWQGGAQPSPLSPAVARAARAAASRVAAPADSQPAARPPCPAARVWGRASGASGGRLLMPRCCLTSLLRPLPSTYRPDTCGDDRSGAAWKSDTGLLQHPGLLAAQGRAGRGRQAEVASAPQRWRGPGGADRRRARGGSWPLRVGVAQAA